MYVETYKHVIHGIRKESQWFKTNLRPLEPPATVAQPDRPKKLRIKELDELPVSTKQISHFLKKITFSSCGEEGHNKKTCKRRKELKQKGNFFPFKFDIVI